MPLSRAIVVLSAEWACLTGGMAVGMALERCARAEDIRIILAAVAALAFAAGAATGRLGVVERRECNAGSLLFLLSSLVVNLMMVRDGTDGHLADGVLCALVAALVFHLAAIRPAPGPARTTGEAGE